MKRPLTPKERAARLAIIAILAFDMIFAYAVVSALFFFLTPRPFDQTQTMCFGNSTENAGTCQIWAFADVRVESVFSDVVPIANPVTMNVKLVVTNQALQNTSLSFAFGYLGASIYSSLNGKLGCRAFVPTLLYNVSPINGTQPPAYEGQATFCFTGQGEYPAIIKVTNGNNSFILGEVPGWNVALDVEPPSSAQNINFGNAELVFTIVLVVFALVESLVLLNHIIPTAFPYRIEYPYRNAQDRNSIAKLKDLIFNRKGQREKDG